MTAVIPKSLRSAAPAAGLLFVVAQQITPEPTLAQARPRVAVIQLENRAGWWLGQLGPAAADILTTALVTSGEFSVIERERLNAILAEQGFQMTGAVSQDQVTQIGQMAGVEYLITGSITRFSVNRRGGSLGGLIRAGMTEAESALNIRAINTRTGEIVAAVQGEGKKRLVSFQTESVQYSESAGFSMAVAEEALGPAIEQVVRGLVSQIENFPVAEVEPEPVVRPQIVGSGSDGAIYIDQGQNFGVQVGQRFKVMRVVDEIVDGNGNVLDVVTDQVGVIEVTRVLSQSSVTRVVEGEAAEGDRLQPAEEG